MLESRDVTSTLLALLSKVVRSISDDEFKRVAIGETRVVLLPPGHRVIEYTPVVDRALKTLSRLSDDELRQLEERQAKLMVVRRGGKVQYPLDVAEFISQVLALASEQEIIEFLNSDDRLSTLNLKKIAAELSIVVPVSVKTREALQVHIAEAVVRDRGRWTWR